MKKIFEGRIHADTPEKWDQLVAKNIWLKGDFLEKARSIDRSFVYVVHPQYACCEYRTKLNIFTFGKLQVTVPFHVIGLPVSMDAPGFTGDLKALIEDYSHRKGLFLVLNLKEIQDVPKEIGKGHTLCTSIFNNPFTSFEEYIAALRSSYRRRIRQAMEKGRLLTVKEIDNKDFDEKLYDLYLQVLKKSHYPLEELSMDFFKESSATIHVFYNRKTPVAFIMTAIQGKELHFLFGGMNYSKRDVFDLYYNMLLEIIKIGIENHANTINFGQTAESSKSRIGCHLEKRYMVFFHKNSVVNFILRVASPIFEYSLPQEIYRVFNRV